jgi:hypothetical protein
LRNEVFYSLEELNRAVSEKMLAHNRKRMQRLPYSREEHFLAVEKPALRPLPATDFEIISKTVLKVGMNGFIYLGREKHYYSVPYAYIGQNVNVNYTRTLVKIYHQGECIATHRRNTGKETYTIVDEHLSSHSRAYRNRTPDDYIKRGEKAMKELGEVISRMFETAVTPPETFYRSCDGLIHLEKTTDAALFRMACQTALQYGIYKYGFIKQLIKSKCEGVVDVDCGQKVTAPPADHQNIRGKDSFK